MIYAIHIAAIDCYLISLLINITLLLNKPLPRRVCVHALRAVGHEIWAETYGVG